ncbi:MAG: zinc-binding dehydrogenase [Candidatus Gastranaerophilales bacterium]|nr:zinc-binding dehydrogenase [Candidatus Gastranaerophilales bacterium]
MKAIQFYEPLNIKYEEVDINDPREGEVQIKIMAALTCGTDVKTYRRGHPVLIKKIPSGFGHEFSGIITKIGKNVVGFNVGDRVVAANSAPCGECFFCKRGEHNLCEKLEFLNGAYAEYINVPKAIVKRNLLHLSDDLTFERAAFCEPLANVVHGVEKTGIKAGQTVGVTGLGPIGLMFVKLAKLKGARVIAAGRNPLKLKMAKEFGGADEVIDLTKYKNPEKIFIDFSEGKKGLDVAVECVGLPEIWERMFTFVRKGGTVHLFGGCKSGTSISIDTRRLHYDEIKVLSIFHHTPLYFREALRLIYEENLPVEKLITETLPLERTEEGLIKHMNGEALKVLIKP